MNATTAFRDGDSEPEKRPAHEIESRPENNDDREDQPQKGPRKRSSSKLDAAMRYAGTGWRVFPVYEVSDAGCACGKTRCQNAGKHPRINDWGSEAATDAKKIKAWWGQWPDANIGIATGRDSGIVVLNVDPRHGGDQSLKDLQNEHGQLPDTWVVKTGGGGTHYYFEMPDGVRLGNSAGQLGRGLDIRGDGGFVVAPPSIHISGAEYEISRALVLAQLPDWIRIAGTASTGGDENRTRRPPISGEEVLEGRRNNYLASVAGKMRRAGTTDNERLAALMGINVVLCQPPLAENEVAAIAQSVSRYGRSDGRGTDWGEPMSLEQLIADEGPRVDFLVPDLIARRGITIVAAPTGVGKTHFAHGLAYYLATGRSFRGRQLNPLNVQIIDRDNGQDVLATRMEHWHTDRTVDATRLKIRPRKIAPPLSDFAFWQSLAVENLDLLILDSFSVFMEGIDEKDTAQIGKALGVLLDLAERGPAILVLMNTTKSGSVVRGSGLLSDRAVVNLELRNVTNMAFDTEADDWYSNLPDASASAFVDRNRRRQGETRFRLGVFSSKSRSALVPSPWVVELNLPKDDQWSLNEVTSEFEGEQARARLTKSELADRARKKKEQAIDDAIDKLESEVSVRLQVAQDEAVQLLLNNGVKRERARQIIGEEDGICWDLVGSGKRGDPVRLVPLAKVKDEPAATAATDDEPAPD